MDKNDPSILLDQLIVIKEEERSRQEQSLKQNIRNAYESLKPVNIIKNAFKDVVSSSDVKTTISDSVMGFASGVIAKKLVVGRSNNPVTSVIGLIVEKLVS